jgi:hypothetical protein
MFLSIDQDSGLNVYGVIHDPSEQYANGTGFEAYNASHWASLYAIVATEVGVTGHYVLTVPAYLTVGSGYSVTFYARTGGSPVPGDPALGSHNFTVESVSPAPVDVTDLIDQLRILSSDTDKSNAIYGETPSGKADGTNTHYKLQNKNIVVASVFISYGTTYRTQLGFLLDHGDGIITFSSAPISGTVLNVDYNFQWFTDEEMSEFLNTAGLHIGSSDITMVEDGLVASLLQYALGYYWLRRASQYAHRYSSSSMGISTQADVVTQNFRKLSELAFKQADSFREMFYKRQGQREAPASGTVSYGIDPYTPRR